MVDLMDFSYIIGLYISAPEMILYKLNAFQFWLFFTEIDWKPAPSDGLLEESWLESFLSWSSWWHCGPRLPVDGASRTTSTVTGTPTILREDRGHKLRFTGLYLLCPLGFKHRDGLSFRFQVDTGVVLGFKYRYRQNKVLSRDWNRVRFSEEIVIVLGFK